MESPSVSRRPSVDTSSTVFHVQQSQAPRSQAMSDGTPPALSSTADPGQAHVPSLGSTQVTTHSPQEVSQPATQPVNEPVERDVGHLLAGGASCTLSTVAGVIVGSVSSGPLGLFMGSIGVSTCACMTLGAAAHDAALIRRAAPEEQSQRCVPDWSPTTVCGGGLMVAGIGLTGLGVAGIGVPTAAVPFTLIPTWAGIATASYGSEVEPNQCLR